MRTGLAILVALSAVLAGCAANPAPQEGAPTALPTREPDAQPNSSSSIREEREAIQLVLGMNDCSGIATVETIPRGQSRAEPPSGWEPSESSVIQITTEIYSCDRFSIGPFERPNVTVLFQGHNNHRAPKDCADIETAVASEILHLIIVTDAEVGNYLRDLGFPARVGEIRMESVELGDPRIERWSVELPDHEPSWLQRVSAMEASIRNTHSTRRFWENPGGGISLLEFEASWRYANEPLPPVAGELNDPFLFGNEMHAGLGPLLDPGSWVNAPVKHLGDC